MASQYDLPYTGNQVKTRIGKVSELEAEMPEKVSDLQNDAGYITEADIPTDVSEFTNDAGYITNAPVTAETQRAQQAEGAIANRVTAIEGKIPSAASSSNQLADKAFVNTGLGQKANASDLTTLEAKVPSGASPSNKLVTQSDIANFITRSVNDLANYYLKNETYNKTEVNNLIGAIDQFHYEIYASTSAITSPASNVLYLIGPTGSGSDKYEEYVYASGDFVKIGDTTIDLSDYVTTTALNTALANYTTTADLTTLLDAKYEKPSGGIPATDLASAVQTSLGKADNALTSSDVIDNVTTDNATKPLSAKQGKVLNDEVSQLGQEVDNKTLFSIDASNLIGSWWVDGSVITFVQSSGMNGTFTSHTAPNKSSTTRPYFRFQNFIVGHKYRLKLTASVDSVNTNKLRFFYASTQTATFSSNRLTDIYGNIADVESGNTLDCLFIAESGKTYIGFTADSFGINETVTITNFSITEEDNLQELGTELGQAVNDSLTKKEIPYSEKLSSYLLTNGIAAITGIHYVVDYFNVTPLKKYRVSGYTYTLLDSRLVLFFNSSNEIIGNVIGTLGAATKNLVITAPTGAAYVGVSGNRNVQDVEFSEFSAIIDLEKIQEDCKIFDINNKIIGYKYTNVLQSILIRRHLVDDIQESQNGTRLSIIFRVYNGYKLTYRGQFGSGCLAQVYGSIANCMIGNSTTRLQNISSYTTAQVTGTINVDGYLGFKFKKPDDSAFSDQDVADALASLTFELKGGIVGDVDTEPVENSQKLITSGGVFNALSGKTYTVTDFESVLESFNTRLRLLLPVKSGWSVDLLCPYGRGTTCAIFDTRQNALIFSSNHLQKFTQTFTTERFVGNVLCDGYLCATVAKTDNSEFSQQDVENCLAQCLFTIKTTQINGLFDKLTPLFIGTLLQNNLNSYGQITSSDSQNVCTASAINVPFKNAKLTFKLPANIYVDIYAGTKTNQMDNLYPGLTGYVVQIFGDSDVYYRLKFHKSLDGSTPQNISVAEIDNFIKTGQIEIYIDPENDIIGRNFDNEKYTKAAMRAFGVGSNPTESHVMPIFAHTSDVHGDAKRFKQFLDYCDFLGVDAALVSGDVVALTPPDSSKYVDDLADSHKTMTLLCMGNHDSAQLDTAQKQYDQIMGHLIVKNGVTTNPAETYPTYFYKDFTDKKIRVIALNSYELKRVNYTTYFTQAQCEWLISVLASTPQDYGVILMYHAPENAVQKDGSNDAFYQETQYYNGYWQGTENEPIHKIIDAFISKTTLNLSYTTRTFPETGDSSVTVNVSADFTNIASGVEFIAHVSGHEHADRIGLVGSTTNRQIMLNVCCGIAMYGIGSSDILARLSDLPREGQGSTQDSFNIYAIDRVNKVIRIAKVGSNVSGDLRERKFMTISYV